ncbi:LOW QUALITY PROTEIN: SFRICE_008543 [Gryllus bimaculatus]|nr:LOW QUALITY PROTEIN: SFRICE_008543 [Gryllus bimaculatus]
MVAHSFRVQEEMLCGKLLAILKKYTERTSICGFRYLTQDGRTCIERLFWLVVLAGCFFANYRLTKSSYYAYQNHPVNFVTDTDYLHWNTSFPQIVVCETESSRVPTSLEFVEKHYPEYYKDDMEFALLVHSFVFEPVCNKCSFNCDDNNNPICDINFNFKELSRKLKWPCKKLMKDCVWNGEPFDCCSKFETVDTELGFCFSANPSVSQSKPPIMVVNKHTGPSGIEFKVTRPAQVFLLGPDESANFNAASTSCFTILRSSLCRMIFTVKEMKNDDALIYEDFERRKCKFPHETESKRFNRYSQTACIVDCRAHHQLSGNFASVRIQMAGLPTQRFKRNLFKSKLDLFVSFGGIAGLFLGASLLSVAEIFIIFCVRPFSRRFFGNKLCCERKQKSLRITIKINIIKHKLMIFWLLVLAGCFFCNYQLTKSSYYAYQHHSVSFVTETDYLHWNTSYPQIVVCEIESASKAPISKEFVIKNFPKYKADWKLAQLIHSAVFQALCIECSHYCNDKNKPTCDVNFNFKELGRKVKEIKNDEALIYEDFEKRKCKFPHETELKRFDRYTESTMCNVYGLKCLGDHNLLLRGFRLKGAAYRAWIECDCPPSCVEPEYNVVYKECSKKRIPLISLAILKKCNYLVLKGYLSEII